MDKKRLSIVQIGVEMITGDAHHVFMVVNNRRHREEVIESHIHTGVVIRPLSDYKDKIVLIIEPMFLTGLQEEAIIKDTIEHLGEKYDTKNLLSHIFRVSWDSENCWTCSELVAHGWLNVLRFLAKDPKKVSPNDILRFILYVNKYKFNRYMIEELYK